MCSQTEKIAYFQEKTHFGQHFMLVNAKFSFFEKHEIRVTVCHQNQKKTEKLQNFEKK